MFHQVLTLRYLRSFHAVYTFIHCHKIIVKTTFISLHSVNQFVFLIEAQCVQCEEIKKYEYLCIKYFNFVSIRV